MRTIGSRLDEHRGIGPGFDFLRVGLACSIVLVHAALLTERGWILQTPLWFVEYALVPSFFALSGFLVIGSALRLSLKNFLINRGLRIIPALGVDVIFCALIVGPLMTTVALSSYFSHGDFARYFLNITGWIHYKLPGVFENNPSSNVNGALWTVPFEIACYALMSALMIIGLVKNARGTALVLVAYLVTGVAIQALNKFGLIPGFAAGLLHELFVSRGAQLIAAFLFGILAYHYRHRIPYSKALLCLSLVICAVAVIVLDQSDVSSVPNRFLVLPAVVYITVWIGVTPVPIPRVFHTGDYSYGIYLYHDPLLQVYITILPLWLVLGPGGWVLLVVLGLTTVSLFAAFSWHFIEKPILGLRKKFSFVAKVRGVAAAGDITIAADVTAKDLEPEGQQIPEGMSQTTARLS